MKTTQEKANQLRAMLDMPKFLQSIDPRDVYRLLDDRDELARLRLGLEEHIQWLRNEAGLHPSPDVFYLQADKLEGLLNSGDDDG